MKAAEAAHRLLHRRDRLRADMQGIEASCGDLGRQLDALRHQKAALALEVEALERAMEALERDVEPAEVV